MRFNQGPRRFENVASNNLVDFVPVSDDEQAMGFQVGVAFPGVEGKRPGSASHSRKIFDFQMPIDLGWQDELEIGIGNWQ